MSADFENEPSDMDWMGGAEAISCDMDGFDAYIWPVYRERGLSKDTAAICFYLHLLVVKKGDGF